LRPLPGPDGRAARVAADHRAGGQQSPRRAVPDRRQARSAAAQPSSRVYGGGHPPLQAVHRRTARASGRGIRRRGVTARRTRLLRRIRRTRPPVARPHPRAVVCEPAHPSRDQQGPPAGRPHRDPRFDRPRHGRRRSVTVLNDAFRANAREVMARYPQPRSALLMVLHAAQEELGYVSDDVVREVAEIFDLKAADVEGVVTFYTMYKHKHPGKFLISVCRNLSCMINGADETIAAMQETLGDPNQTTDDGLCSWETVECLATCHWAVAAQVNYLDV